MSSVESSGKQAGLLLGKGGVSGLGVLVELLRLLAVGRPAVGAVLAGLFRVVTETGLEIETVSVWPSCESF